MNEEINNVYTYTAQITLEFKDSVLAADEEHADRIITEILEDLVGSMVEQEYNIEGGSYDYIDLK